MTHPVCVDCAFVLGADKAPAPTLRVFFVGSSKPALLCDEHAYRRDEHGEVGKAVRITGGGK